MLCIKENKKKIDTPKRCSFFLAASATDMISAFFQYIYIIAKDRKGAGYDPEEAGIGGWVNSGEEKNKWGGG